MKKTLFVFLRHAESEKNIIDITGGKGKKLTELGIRQAEAIADHLFGMFGADQCDIISSPAIQAIQTAQIISRRIGSSVTVSDELVSAGMGVVSGLTAEEISNHFPELMELLKKWRAYEIEACELSIPGIESPTAFWERMCRFMTNHAVGGVKIVVCTRSVMTFARNFSKHNSPEKGGGYKHTDTAHCQILSFALDDDGVLIDNTVLVKTNDML